MVEEMNTRDPVREFLRQRGCPEPVTQGGLHGLVKKWENTVRAVKQGYAFGLDDYLNDLDGRQLIEETFAVASEKQKEAFLDRVRRADTLMKSLTVPLEKCLWGETVAKSEGWTPKKNWWYFSKPINAAPELLSEIEGK
jgi:hypothetical protein